MLLPFFPQHDEVKHTIKGPHNRLTRLAFSLRNWTKVFLSSLCEIWIPLTLCSCSDSAQNKQFPDAWLSETKNPFFAATVLRLDGRMVLLRTWSASHRKFCKDGRMFSAGKKRKLFLHFQQFDRCALRQILLIIFMGHIDSLKVIHFSVPVAVSQSLCQ